MRLIDADTLIKKAYDEAKGMAEPYDDFGVLVEWLVDKSPTIELERKTGKWIDGYKRQTCSVCRQRGYRSWKFCPNCGAKMEEGE